MKMLFDTYQLGGILKLSNRIVMAPMTRSRAVDNNTPNKLMAEYYGQRAAAGLIITEGTSPSPNGLGYSRIPGLYNDQHVAGWKLITDTVHNKGGKIFIQLMHCGRVVHQDNLPPGAKCVAPSGDICPGEMWSDKAMAKLPHTTPHVLEESEIYPIVEEFANSAKLAIKAGFDGLELHAANGYLLEQFLNPNVNKRTDAYGKDAAGRNRFTLEVAKACVAAIGAKKVGIRISPQGVFNGTGDFPGLEDQYLSLVRQLSDLGLAYLHVVDHSAMGAPPVSVDLKKNLRAAFSGTYIATGGFDGTSGEETVENKTADLIGFGRPFISNPDLVERIKKGVALAKPIMNTFYTADEKGYTDYPTAT
jgi:N-ethylmaleimide reductase